MSDLAPFVAATLRDKVVADMEQEIKELQRKLTQSQTIQVVGVTDEEETVYYSGLLQNGQHESRCSQLNVRLSKQESKSGGCPLHQLPNLSLRIGGFHRADLRVIAHDESIEADRRDGDNYKYMRLRGAGVMLEFCIHRWPRAEWEPLLDRRHLLAGDNLFDNLYQASQDFPEAEIVFKSITLRTVELKGVIPNLPEPAKSKLQREQEQEQKRRQYKNYIMDRMRESGYDRWLVVGSSEIMEVLMELKTFSAATQRDREMIDLVVRLHRESRDFPNPAQAFYDSVQRFKELGIEL